VSDPLYIRLRDVPDSGLELDLELRRELLADALEGEDSRIDHDQVRLAGTLTKQGENAFFRGRLLGSLELACSRCLAPAKVSVDQPLNVTFTPPLEGESEGGGAQGDVLEDVDYAILTHVKGEWIADLREFVREQVVLTIPIQPLCREDCAGLCSRCGKDLNEGPCGCPEEHAVDPRFAALEKLREKTPE
jgi:uncharacterized protein